MFAPKYSFKRRVTTPTSVRPSVTPAHSHFSQNGALSPRDCPIGTVLVTGGAGYVGSVLIEKLLADGSRVRVLDPLMYGLSPLSSLSALLHGPNVELVIGDCRDSRVVSQACRGVDAVVHLAAIVGDEACAVNAGESLEINFEPIHMLARVARENGVKRFLFASSCSVYGARDDLADETSELRPVSLYAQMKADAEAVLMNSASESFHPSVLRLATVFGLSYRPRFDLVVNLLSAQACAEGAITIYNGQSWRPFIHVGDVAAGFLAVLNAEACRVSSQVFNLGDSRLNFTLSQLGGKIAEVFPNVQVRTGENRDRRNYHVSFDKIRRNLGFNCSLTLHQGIREFKDALQNQPAFDYRDIQYHNYKFLLNRSASSKSRLVAEAN